MQRCLWIAAVACVLSAGQVSGGFQGVVTIEGLATGTFEGQSFRNALVSFAGAYDTDNVTSAISPLSGAWESFTTIVGSVDVAGIGSAGLGNGEVLSYSQNKQGRFPPSDIGMVFAGQSQGVTEGFLVDGGFSPFNADVDLDFSFGPQHVAFGPPPFPIGRVFTSQGDLNITSIDSFSWSVQVTVTSPAPPGFLLAGLGFPCLLLVGRKRS